MSKRVLRVVTPLCLAASAFGCAKAADNSGNGFPGGVSADGGQGGAASIAVGGSSGSVSQGGSNGLITVAAGGGGGEANDSDAGLDPDAACAAESRDSTLIATDLFIMVDRSVSMGCGAADTACDNPATNPTATVPPTRWTAVTDAISAFLNAPTSVGVGAGLGFFGLSGADFCNVAAYATPAAAIAALPASATNIVDTIKKNSPGGTTPTVPALQGSINYATSYTMATPGRTAAVVFVTDGLPNGCSSSVASATTLAQTAFMGTPSIKTYVVGLGFTMNLDAIALAGSGGAHHYFPAQGDVTAALSTALKQISQQVIKCDYTIPTMGQALDYGRVNVQTKVGMAGTPGLVGNVSDATQCSAAGGWYYDVSPGAAGKPSKITLCPQSCDPLSNANGSSLKVLIGCATVPAMVK